MPKTFDISESSSELEPACTEYIIDKNPRETLNEIYQESQNITRIRAGPVLLDSPDLHRLYPGEWLNDKVIEAYLGLLYKHFGNIYVFSTHFYTSIKNMPFNIVMEWLEYVDLYSYDYLILPVHLFSHWTLAIIHGNSVEYYDSLGYSDPYVSRDICDMMKAIRYIKYDSIEPYYIKDMSAYIPHQNNSDDCGVFCCMYVRYRIDPDCSKFFTSDLIGLLRKRMLHELLANKIIYGCTEQK